MTSRRTRRKRDLEASTAAKLLAERAKETERERKARRKQRRKMLHDLFTGVGGAVGFRYRAQLRPFYVLAGLYLAGLGAEASGNPPGVVALAVLIGVPAVLFWLRGTLQRRAEQLYALCCCAAGVAWLGLAAAGMTGNRVVDVVGVLAWAVGAALWLREHRVRDSDVPEQPQPPSTTFNERWDANIRDRNGQMKGAELSTPVPFEYGNTYSVQLVPGGQHLATAQTSLPLIASGLRTPMAQLVLEQHPDLAETDPTVLRLRHVTRSPIKKTVYFEQPRFEDGKILLGLYADGIGEASFRLLSDDSMWGGFILGGTGSGKSRLLELIAVVCRWLGMPIIYLDGQSGASSPALWEHATWSGGPEDAPEVLAALERGAKKRSKYNRAHGLSGFEHTPARPGILTIADECHRIFTQPTGERWAEAARENRKLGMPILAASQAMGLATFGGEDALRSSLLYGNIIVGRTLSRISTGMIPGLDLDPTTFPAMPGYAYSVAVEGSDARTAPFRGRFLPSAKDRERHPEIPVASSQEWFTQLPDPEVDRLTARGFGDPFLWRHELAEQRKADLLAELDDDAEDPPRRESIVIPAPAHAGQSYQVDESGTDAPGNVCEAILALDWEQYPERTRKQIVAALAEAGTPYKVTSVQKALHEDNMRRPGGEMVLISHGLYRLATELERRVAS
jgi:hypothetical protein